MKIVICSLLISLSTLFGREIAKRIGEKEAYYKNYLDFLSELLFAVRYSKETVLSVKERFDFSQSEKHLKGEEKSAIDEFFRCIGKSDTETDEIRILSEKGRVEKIIERTLSKSSEKKKCAIIVGAMVGVIASLVII